MTPSYPSPIARAGGAKALLYTILGEVVLPCGGEAWTSTLVDALALVGVAEKNARQAIARVGEHGTIEPRRTGREVRWVLTASGRKLLESGAARIYDFGRSPVAWSGEWLVAHCPVPEAQRPLRQRLRTRLAFEGFGEINASLVVSPHVAREPLLRATLDDLGLSADCVVLRSRTTSHEADVELAARAWNLDELAAAYGEFAASYRRRRPSTDEAMLAASVALVDDWRRFPFIDPELPGELLPRGWAGAAAVVLFHDRRDAWQAGTRRWFATND